MVIEENESKIKEILLKDLLDKGISEININITQISLSQRIDKLLSSYIKDLSRTMIEKAIKKGDILLDGKLVRTKENIKSGSIIKLDVKSIFLNNRV